MVTTKPNSCCNHACCLCSASASHWPTVPNPRRERRSCFIYFLGIQCITLCLAFQPAEIVCARKTVRLLYLLCFSGTLSDGYIHLRTGCRLYVDPVVSQLLRKHFL